MVTQFAQVILAAYVFKGELEFHNELELAMDGYHHLAILGTIKPL